MPRQIKLRCPCCGSLASATDFDAAGHHRIEVKRVLKGLGRGRGFKWSQEPVSGSLLHMLANALQRAADQVARHAAALEAKPPVPCAGCTVDMLFNLDTGDWWCPECQAVFPDVVIG